MKLLFENGTYFKNKPSIYFYALFNYITNSGINLLQELTVRQEMGDLKGECRAHGHLGAVHMSLGNYTNAIKCYQEQLERAKELRESAVEAQAFGNLGIARLNMGHYEDAIGYLEQQLATLEQLSTPTALMDKVKNLSNLLHGCYNISLVFI